MILEAPNVGIAGSNPTGIIWKYHRSSMSCYVQIKELMWADSMSDETYRMNKNVLNLKKPETFCSIVIAEENYVNYFLLKIL